MTLSEDEKKQIDELEEENLPRFLTLEDAAQRLGVSKRTLKRYAQDKNNPFPIIYFSKNTARVPWEQFNLWIDTQKERG